APLLLLVIAYDALVRRERLSRELAPRAVAYGILALVFAGYLGARFAVLGRFGPSVDQQVAAAMSSTAIAAVRLRVFATYLRLLLVPVNLQVDYAIGASTLPGPLPVMLSLAALGSVAALFVVLRKKSAAAAFAGTWVVLCLLPVSQIVP